MNILFVTQEDPFYIKIFFEEFLKEYGYLSEIKGVIICSTLGKKTRIELVKQMYDFYGLLGFLNISFRFLISKLRRSSLIYLFAKYHIYSERRNDINSQDFIDEWKSKGIDLIISVACSVIFKQRLLSFPSLGCINIHHAKLPRYRGMMPNFWQMLNDEKMAGITIHKINSKIDDGDIILQKEIEIFPQDSLDSLIKRSKKAGASLMIQAIEKIKEGRTDYIKNDIRNSTYCCFPSKKDVKEFRKKGKRLL